MFSSALPDFIHSLFTSVCLSVTRKGASHVLRGIPQLVIPSSQGWGGGGGSDLSISTAHGVFLHLFVCYCFVFARAQEKNTTSLVSWPCRVPTCVGLLKPFDQTHCSCLALQTAAVKPLLLARRHPTGVPTWTSLVMHHVALPFSLPCCWFIKWESCDIEESQCLIELQNREWTWLPRVHASMHRSEIRP